MIVHAAASAVAAAAAAMGSRSSIGFVQFLQMALLKNSTSVGPLVVFCGFLGVVAGLVAMLRAPQNSSELLRTPQSSSKIQSFNLMLF